MHCIYVIRTFYIYIYIYLQKCIYPEKICHMRVLKNTVKLIFNSCNIKMVPIQVKFRNNILALK